MPCPPSIQRSSRSSVPKSLDAFRRVSQPGLLDKVELDVTFGAGMIQGAFLARCKQAIAERDKPQPRPVDLGATLPRRKLKLTLVWDGKSLVLDVASQARWEELLPKE